MRKITPGYNELGWTGQVRCTEHRYPDFSACKEMGCGALLEVTKDDLYTVTVFNQRSLPREEARFTCPCGAENALSCGEFFNGLPNKEDWIKSHKSQ